MALLLSSSSYIAHTHTHTHTQRHHSLNIRPTDRPTDRPTYLVEGGLVVEGSARSLGLLRLLGLPPGVLLVLPPLEVVELGVRQRRRVVVLLPILRIKVK